MRTPGRTSEPEVLRIEPRHRFETSSHHLSSTGQVYNDAPTHPVCETLLSSPQIAFFQAPMYHFLKGAIAAYARAYIRTRSAPYRTQTPIRDLIPSPPLDRSGLQR